MLFYIYQYNDLKNFVFDFDSNGRNHLLYDLYILMNDIKVILDSLFYLSEGARNLSLRKNRSYFFGMGK